MKQLLILLLFIVGYSSVGNTRAVVLVPAVTTQNITTSVVQKTGFWSKVKTKARVVVKMMEDPGKQIAIIAHLTIIGLIIALVMNADTKSDLASFYIRQVLGLAVVGIGISVVVSLLSFIPVVNLIAAIVSLLAFLGLVVLFFISLLAAIQGEKKEVPIFGKMFQKWFASIG